MILKKLLGIMNNHRVQGSIIISIPLQLANAISQQLHHFLPSKYCCTSSPRFPFFFFSLISLSLSPLLCNVFCCIFLFSVDTILLCVCIYIYCRVWNRCCSAQNKMENQDLSKFTITGDPQSLQNKISQIRMAGPSKLQVLFLL